MGFYGKKPEGACFYAKDPTGKMEVIAWRPPVEPGGDVTLALTGRTRSQLVRDILDGRYDHVLRRGEVSCHADL